MHSKSDKDVYSLRYAKFEVPIVEAVQVLPEKSQALTERIESLEAQLADKSAKGSR